jgi:hypothetical protein
MDLYRLLAELTSDCEPGMRTSRSPRPQPLPEPTTIFTRTVETTDEERGATLLGSVAP